MKRRSVNIPAPMGNISPTGDVRVCVIAVMQRLKDKGPHLVMVSPEGKVHMLLRRDDRYDLVCAEYPTWLAGTFTSSEVPSELRDAMVTTYADHQTNAVEEVK